MTSNVYLAEAAIPLSPFFPYGFPSLSPLSSLLPFLRVFLLSFSLPFLLSVPQCHFTLYKGMTHSATAVVQALTVSCWNCCHRLATGLVPPPLPPTSPTALPAHARHPPLPRRYPLILHPPQYDQSGLSKMQIWGQHPSTKNIPVAPHHIQDKGQAPEAGVLTPSWRDSIISYHNMNYTAGITLIIMYWIFKIFLNVSFLLE